MSLSQLYALDGEPLPGLPPGPRPCAELLPLRGRSFWMPPGDPRLDALFRGGEAPTPPLDNLVGARRLWEEHPEWMDLLDPDSPARSAKLLERALYLRRWEPHLRGARRVLDLGGGVGRFAVWLLERGLEVELVDPDLRSLWRAVAHAAGLPGRLDVHWSTGERLPELAPVDAALAVEVLCYAEDPALVLGRLRALLRPGGLLLASVEARWGWAAALDAPAGALGALLGDGVVHVPGDRWVRTYEAGDFRALLEGAGFELLELRPTHYLSGGPFELVAGELSPDEALAWEERLAAHPRLAHLNRAWTAVARRP